MFGKWRTCLKIDFANFYTLENPTQRQGQKEFWVEYITQFPEERCKRSDFFLEHIEDGCVEGVF